MKLRIFAHSWTSDWNHGNAHFLRGLAQELVSMGHEVRCYEQEDAWSRANLQREGRETEARAVRQFRDSFPELDVRTYGNDGTLQQFLSEELRDAEVVLIHEWNPPHMVNWVLSLKSKYGFRTLFHDTHHRAYTSPKEILQFELSRFDGVLAFGEAIRRIYVEGFGVKRAWTFHEAADTVHFKPLARNKDTDVIWVGNWGDEERTRELQEFLLQPARSVAARFAVHGVRYPEQALALLADAGAEYRGYLPNLDAPRVYADSLLTVHVPRRFYTNGLSGIPTIRVFEALACGIPLLCSPWTDTDGLFTEGEDYVVVNDRHAMEAEMRRFLRDDSARRQLAAHGIQTIQQRHTCGHRARQLIDICEELGK
jgi:spore maturation protein CgeB